MDWWGIHFRGARLRLERWRTCLPLQVADQLYRWKQSMLVYFFQIGDSNVKQWNNNSYSGFQGNLKKICSVNTWSRKLYVKKDLEVQLKLFWCQLCLVGLWFLLYISEFSFVLILLIQEHKVFIWLHDS